jgi:hypothetical protein
MASGGRKLRLQEVGYSGFRGAGNSGCRVDCPCQYPDFPAILIRLKLHGFQASAPKLQEAAIFI